MPHIAYRKKTGNIRLEQIRISVEGPPLEMLRLSNQVGASQDEPAFVALNYIREPLSSGQRSNKDEHRARRHALQFVGIGTKDRNFFQMYFAMRFGHAAVCPNLDVGHLLNLVDQILRHGTGERTSSHQNDDA